MDLFRHLPDLTEPIQVPAAGGLLVAGACIYWGGFVRETGGVNPVGFAISDSTIAGAPIQIDAFRAPLSGIDRTILAGPVFCERGVFATLIGTGTPSAVVWVVPAEKIGNYYDRLWSDILGQLVQ